MREMFFGLMRKVAEGLNPPDLPCAKGGCKGNEMDLVGLLGWVYVAVGVLGVIVIIIAGIQYMTSEGEPEKTKRAQATITYTVIGLIIVTAAAAIVGFVLGAF